MFNCILLGVIQGLTEFLPVSSSAHLVFAQKILRISGNGLALPVILHLGTALALIVFFFKDILNLFQDKKSLFLIAAVTLITGVIGVSGKDFFEALFSSTKAVAISLIITGIILILTKTVHGSERKELNFKDAFILGLAQSVAIVPGISRSGATISVLLFRKMAKEQAFKFSFLAGIPAILGAGVLEAKDIVTVPVGELRNFIFGFIFSFLVGIFSLWLIRGVIRKAKLHYFGYYCITAGIIASMIFK